MNILNYFKILLFLIVSFMTGNSFANPRVNFQISRPHGAWNPPVHHSVLAQNQSSTGGSKKMISATEAKKIAEDRFGGTALSVKLEDGGGAGSVYRVKLIKNGRVKTVTVTATP